MNPMGPTLTLSGPWAKPSYKNPGTVGRCKISPSGIILNGLTLNLSALNDQALPDKRGPLPRLQGTVPHSPLTWIPGIKTICKHFETVYICKYINFAKTKFQRLKSTAGSLVSIRESAFPIITLCPTKWLILSL